MKFRRNKIMWYEYVLGALFFGTSAALMICILVDTMRCKHEWKETGVRVYCKRRKHSVDALCLTCKKCGKVKVIK
jgi:hypothetical protein